MTKKELMKSDCKLLTARDIAITGYNLLPAATRGRMRAARDIETLTDELEAKHTARYKLGIKVAHCGCNHRDIPARLVAARQHKLIMKLQKKRRY